MAIELCTSDTLSITWTATSDQTQILGLFGSRQPNKKLDPVLWQALKDAGTYEEWEDAAEALNTSDPHLVEWKEEPRGRWDWDTIRRR
jgi:hypothetical protein